MKKRAGLVTAALGVALLAGCAPAGGTAAVVNGVNVPVSQVNEWTESCNRAVEKNSNLRPGSTIPTAFIVSAAVFDQISRQFIDTYDPSQFRGEDLAFDPSAIDESQLDRIVVGNGLGYLLADEGCATAVRGWARSYAIATKLGAQGAKYYESNEVYINPRYGTWDARTWEIMGTGSMSRLLDRELK